MSIRLSSGAASFAPIQTRAVLSSKSTSNPFQLQHNPEALPQALLSTQYYQRQSETAAGEAAAAPPNQPKPLATPENKQQPAIKESSTKRLQKTSSQDKMEAQRKAIEARIEVLEAQFKLFEAEYARLKAQMKKNDKKPQRRESDLALKTSLGMPPPGSSGVLESKGKQLQLKMHNTLSNIVKLKISLAQMMSLNSLAANAG